MSRLKLFLMLAAALLTGGCTRLFDSDGTPESEVVRQWLSQDTSSRRAGTLIEPGAQLVMSDYGMPLTRKNLRRMGPDRFAGCERSKLTRRGPTVVASWTCPTDTDLPFRTVYFQVRKGRIASAKYTEAYQAVERGAE
jgi:hypothetical protein